MDSEKDAGHNSYCILKIKKHVSFEPHAHVQPRKGKNVHLLTNESNGFFFLTCASHEGWSDATRDALRYSITCIVLARQREPYVTRHDAEYVRKAKTSKGTFWDITVKEKKKCYNDKPKNRVRNVNDHDPFANRIQYVE